MITGITHFTSQAAAAAILNGWCMTLSRQGSRTGGPKEVNVRLHSRWGTNDSHEPHVAAYGKDVTTEKHPTAATPRSRNTFPDDVFMWCGSTPQSEEQGELPNRLEMWRA